MGLLAGLDTEARGLPGIESQSSGLYSDTILTELPQFLYNSGKRPKYVRKCLHSLLNDVGYLTTAQRISGFTPSRLFTHARYIVTNLLRRNICDVAFLSIGR
jgi:hypothetical protein